MKCVLVLAVVLAFCAIQFATAASLDEEWAAYKITHKRVFDAEEDATRKALFAANLKKVNDHNVKYKAGEVTYELGINHFSDRTEAELKQMHGVRLPLQKN